MFNQMSRVKVHSNGLLFTSQWHLHLADIANAYQSSTLSQMSTDVNKPLRQQSKQLLDREQTGLFAKLNWGCPLSVVRSVCVDGRLTTGAVVTSQGLWWLDERASPGGANGDILNLEQQPVCQYTQRKGRWDRVPGRAALKCGEVSAVCPDREGHGHDSTSYWRSRGDKGVSHNGGEMEEASPMELGRGGWGAGLVLSFTPAGLFEEQRTVTLFRQLTACSHWTQAVNSTWHSIQRFRSFVYPLFALPLRWATASQSRLWRWNSMLIAWNY